MPESQVSRRGDLRRAAAARDFGNPASQMRRKRRLMKLVGSGSVLLSLWICLEACARVAVIRLSHRSGLIGTLGLGEGCPTSREDEMAAGNFLQTIGRMRPHLLREALYHPDPEVRAAGVLVLGSNRTPGMFEAVLKLTADGDPRVRCCALAASAHFRDRRAVPVLIKALEHRNAQDPRKTLTQAVAVEALREIGDPEGIRAVRAWYARQQAAQGGNVSGARPSPGGK